MNQQAGEFIIQNTIKFKNFIINNERVSQNTAQQQQEEPVFTDFQIILRIQNFSKQKLSNQLT